jgi:hypothetical protein
MALRPTRINPSAANQRTFLMEQQGSTAYESLETIQPFPQRVVAGCQLCSDINHPSCITAVGM